MDYNELTTTPTPEQYAAVAGVSLIMMVFYIAVFVVMLAAWWKIFTKAGKEGWKAIIPVYNLVVILEIIAKPVWWIILMFIPFVNFIVLIMVMNELAKTFGKGVGTTLGLIFLPIVFFPILAFGDAKYTKPAMPTT